MSKKSLGVCYYPEQWPEEAWERDASEMIGLGITQVRIGEFAWARMEPTPDDLTLDWLDRAIDTLAKSGLKVMLCTPTATPPRWMINKYPDIYAVDEQGNSRQFGSRRHYCFSHPGYRTESARITEILAKRYGKHEGINGWQTDNEYGCHDTVYSYSSAAVTAFRQWLQEKYGKIENLNTAWGNVFWSMDYSSFDEIELPNQTVTQPNPSHSMDFRRFSSNQVVTFNREQVEIIREHSPDRFIVHNFMGRITDFDHFEVGKDLDLSSWDSYPLGFLFRMTTDRAKISRSFRQGDPDFQAFHHDLYRAVGNGQFWVMEQQAGQVNWAPSNAVPLDGSVRLWTWEAFAHGADCVSYFRWRQPRFAQEQMHSGLKRPDNMISQGGREVHKTALEIQNIGEFELSPAPVGIVFDYESQWASEIQPHGENYDYFNLVFECYKSFRNMGLDIDFISSNVSDLNQYKIVVIPGLHRWTEILKGAVESYSGTILVGPRSGDKDENFQIARPLPPAISVLPDLKVSRVETLCENMSMPVENFGNFIIWREFVEGPQDVIWRSVDGRPALLKQNHAYYLAGWPNPRLWKSLIHELANDANLSVFQMPFSVRKRETSIGTFYYNYGSKPVDLARVGVDGSESLDGFNLQPSGVSLIKR